MNDTANYYLNNPVFVPILVMRTQTEICISLKINMRENSFFIILSYTTSKISKYKDKNSAFSNLVFHDLFLQIQKV